MYSDRTDFEYNWGYYLWSQYVGIMTLVVWMKQLGEIKQVTEIEEGFETIFLENWV